MFRLFDSDLPPDRAVIRQPSLGRYRILIGHGHLEPRRNQPLWHGQLSPHTKLDFCMVCVGTVLAILDLDSSCHEDIVPGRSHSTDSQSNTTREARLIAVIETPLLAALLANCVHPTLPSRPDTSRHACSRAQSDAMLDCGCAIAAHSMQKSRWACVCHHSLLGPSVSRARSAIHH